MLRGEREIYIDDGDSENDQMEYWMMHLFSQAVAFTTTTWAGGKMTFQEITSNLSIEKWFKSFRKEKRERERERKKKREKQLRPTRECEELTVTLTSPT